MASDTAGFHALAPANRQTAAIRARILPPGRIIPAGLSARGVCTKPKRTFEVCTHASFVSKRIRSDIRKALLGGGGRCSDGGTSQNFSPVFLIYIFIAFVSSAAT
jgi:hypothetical protein